MVVGSESGEGQVRSDSGLPRGWGLTPDPRLIRTRHPTRGESIAARILAQVPAPLDRESSRGLGWAGPGRAGRAGRAGRLGRARPEAGAGSGRGGGSDPKEGMARERVWLGREHGPGRRNHGLGSESTARWAEPWSLEAGARPGGRNHGPGVGACSWGGTMVLGRNHGPGRGFWHGSGLGTRGRDHGSGAAAWWGRSKRGRSVVASGEGRGRGGPGPSAG
jgi:hypothetical protein